MLALYNFLPLYYPSCGNRTWLDRVDNPLPIIHHHTRRAGIIKTATDE
jgi:hypothetical protein